MKTTVKFVGRVMLYVWLVLFGVAMFMLLPALVVMVVGRIYGATTVVARAAIILAVYTVMVMTVLLSIGLYRNFKKAILQAINRKTDVVSVTNSLPLERESETPGAKLESEQDKKPFQPRLDTLKLAKDAMTYWLDEGKPATRAFQLAGIDYKTFPKYIPFVIAETEEPKRSLWIQKIQDTKYGNFLENLGNPNFSNTTCATVDTNPNLEDGNAANNDTVEG